jgi:hypothetical protein
VFTIGYKFKDLDECANYLGRENLVAISYLPQILFYSKNKLQPVFIGEREGMPDKLVCYYQKSPESAEIKRKWDATKANK